MHPISTDGPSPFRVVGAIPARYESMRLPGKALRKIDGVSMIERVHRQVSRADGLSRVVVLTDDERIMEAVEGFGGECEMTPADCASGTDRIAWAAQAWTDADAVINIQGDEPLIDPAEISRIAGHLAEHRDDPVLTVAAPGSDGDADDPNVVKVVLDSSGYALYFSRAPIPYPRAGARQRPPMCHLGIYGYQLPTLLEIAAADPTPLEMSESLEQLRMLESGVRIRVLETARAWWGVDTIEDLERVEAFLQNRQSA